MKFPELVSKLKALAEHPATPPHEAEAARAKLRRLMERHNLTEEDLNGTATHVWTEKWIQSHERELLLWVASMILNTSSVPITFSKYMGKWNVSINSTFADKIDVLACFSYYRALLSDDRQRMKDEAAALRGEAKRLLKEVAVISSGVSKLPDLMRSKYEIYPPYLVEQWEAMEAACEEDDTPLGPLKLRKLTRAQEKKLEAEYHRRQAARRHMTQADAWQKGAGLETGTFALTN